MKAINCSSVLLVVLGLVAGCATHAIRQTDRVPATAARIDAELLGPMADAMIDRLGAWTAELQMLAPDGRGLASFAGTQTNRLIGGRWLVSALSSADARRPFEGLGVVGYDPSKRQYVGIWVDSLRGHVAEVVGSYNPHSGVFTTTSMDRAPDGSPVESIQVTETLGDDAERVTMLVPGANGAMQPRMTLQLRKLGADPAPGHALALQTEPGR